MNQENLLENLLYFIMHQELHLFKLKLIAHVLHLIELVLTTLLSKQLAKREKDMRLSYQALNFLEKLILIMQLK